MVMRPLLIDESVREKIKVVRDYAVAHPVTYPNEDANWDRIETIMPIDQFKQCCITINSYMVVFTISHAHNVVFRHITVSIPQRDEKRRYPDPMAVFVIAQEFGFTGWRLGDAQAPSDWLMTLEDQGHPALVMMQPIASVKAPSKLS